MAIINCPECQKEISDLAQKCPLCGFPLKKTREKRRINYKMIKYFGIVFLVIGIIYAGYSLYMSEKMMSNEEKAVLFALKDVIEKERLGSNLVLEYAGTYQHPDGLYLVALDIYKNEDSKNYIRYLYFDNEYGGKIENRIFTAYSLATPEVVEYTKGLHVRYGWQMSRHPYPGTTEDIYISLYGSSMDYGDDVLSRDVTVFGINYGELDYGDDIFQDGGVICSVNCKRIVRALDIKYTKNAINGED